MALPDIEWETPGARVERDRFGRPLIAPAAGGDPVPHTRATTISSTLDDKTTLINWAAHRALAGILADPKLLDEAKATDPNSSQFKTLGVRAKKAGGGDLAAHVGSAIHAFTEAIDLGGSPTIYTARDGEPDIDPNNYTAELVAYTRTLEDHGVEILPDLIEQLVVNPHHAEPIAGSPDRVVMWDGQRHIFDLKTGSSVNFGSLGWSTQLSIYADADTIYRPETASHVPMPDVNHDLGLVLHLPAGGDAALYTIDLTPGREAVPIAIAVRQIRKVKPLARVTTTVRAVAPPAAAAPAEQPLTVAAAGGSPGSVEGETPSAAGTEFATRQEWLRGRLTALRDQYGDETVAAEWPVGLVSLKAGGLDGEQLDAIDAHLSAFEKAHGAQFHGLDPTTEPPPTQPVTYTIPETWVTPYEGPMMDPGDIAALRAKVAELPAADKALIVGWIVTAGAAGRPCSTAELPSARRFEVARAMLALAKIEDTGEVASRSLIEKVMGIEMQPAFSVAAALGSLSQEQANELAHLADLAGRETPTFTELGTLEVVR